MKPQFFIRAVFISTLTLICLIDLVASDPGPIAKPFKSSLTSKEKLKNKANKVSRSNRQQERYDDSVNDYLTQRTCWWNEMCKEEFTARFRCRCPLWSFCSSPGRYYNAYCSMSGAGYLWNQPRDKAFFKKPYKLKKSRQSHKKPISS